jgi:hypothetical protein
MRVIPPDPIPDRMDKKTSIMIKLEQRLLDLRERLRMVARESK